MTQVSISEGARLAGVSRSTLNRHLKDGALSKHRDNAGRPYVETSELVRFYGELSQSDRTEKDGTGQRGTAQIRQDMSELERKLMTTEAALDVETVRRKAEQERREAAEAATAKWQAQAERLTTLLTDQRQTTTQSFWKRLFG